MHADLVAIVGADHVEADVTLEDASGLRGRAGALVAPADAREVAAVVAWCYDRDVPMIPVGGRSGYSGGIVPRSDDAGAVAIALHRLDAIRSFDPLLWRMHAEAGVTTATVARRARENGLLFPPDPGAAEQSQLGGNLATNAGGPHAFKYGVTGRWVTGVEAVLAPGEVVSFGGPVRKDVAGLDLRSLLIGSEGTLGIVTAAWLRLVPAPGEAFPVAAAFGSVREGCAAIDAVLGSGVVPAAVEYLDGRCLTAAPPPFLDADAALLVVCEAESAHDRDELLEALGSGAVSPPAAEVWRWREGVSIAVRAARGEKLSEDIAVPVERLADAIEGTIAIGERHGLEGCSWGHAGDGNLHSSFLLDPGDDEMRTRANAAAHDLFDLARELGGTASGEHGIGLLKAGQLSRQWSPAAVDAARAVKRALDPKGLFNPGKKEP
ncbi:MAG TPA: FAD-linked oxidase C-terminal domain-containing protein [Baekduia sp.]|uniref:FAD-binding oxidoreductase n=1 Tax=Baekduia sp. TaxID=2600305 RepID=UPI002D78B4C0|nr:FAD-linked oxidase C-terminal domain-containing protein [Baekduia sp.]HET6505484.1 FAD-linked oxidase C-terminal domain-containing protein [Baekduia sp.]